MWASKLEKPHSLCGQVELMVMQILLIYLKLLLSILKFLYNFLILLFIKVLRGQFVEFRFSQHTFLMILEALLQTQKQSHLVS